MTSNPTDAELVEWAATAVMGYEQAKLQRVLGSSKPLWKRPDSLPFNFDPLTNANDRDAFVERMRELGWCFEVFQPGRDWSCTRSGARFFKNFDRADGKFTQDEDSLGRAVLLAAYEAMHDE